MKSINLISENDMQENFVIFKQEKLLRIRIMRNAIIKLNSREQEIIKYRKLIDTPITLKNLSYKYSISTERIRQIEENAIKKIIKYIN